VHSWRLDLEARRRIDVGRGVELVLGRRVEEQLVTLLWVLYSPETYLKLVHDCGMPRPAYEDFLTDSSRRLVDGA
jgi:hypothetical protein